MTPAEHLDKIAAKCRANLALAENAESDVPPDYTYCRGAEAFYQAAITTAEAGWRSTLAAIEGLRWLSLGKEDVIGHRAVAAILAAWPEEIL